MRALEAEIGWTFPAIKKQVDSLQEAGVVEVDKDNMKRSITIQDEAYKILRNLFLYALEQDVRALISEHEFVIKDNYFGKIFGYDIETDLVIVYDNCDKPLLDIIKTQISDLFHKHGIEKVYVTFFSAGERQKRYQLADRFVLSVLRVHS